LLATSNKIIGPVFIFDQDHIELHVRLCRYDCSKRYRLYLKEEERKKRHSEWTQYVIAAILWLVKLISNTLEKVNVKSKRVISDASSFSILLTR